MHGGVAKHEFAVGKISLPEPTATRFYFTLHDQMELNEIMEFAIDDAALFTSFREYFEVQLDSSKSQKKSQVCVSSVFFPPLFSVCQSLHSGFCFVS